MHASTAYSLSRVLRGSCQTQCSFSERSQDRRQLPKKDLYNELNPRIKFTIRLCA